MTKKMTTKVERNRCLQASGKFYELREKVTQGLYKIDTIEAHDLAVLVMEMSNENHKIFNIAMGKDDK